MQFTKDSFYMTLLQRLVAINPQQTVTVNGTIRPAIIVAENELVVPVVPAPDAFYIEWGAAQVVSAPAGTQGLMKMDCVLSYHTFGTVESGVDRGRTLAALDTELLNICQPAWTSKRDYSQAPSVDLGTRVCWTRPVFGKVSGSEGLRQEALPNRSGPVRLQRSASLSVFFFPEVAL